MKPDALARSLTMVGVAGLVYFYFVSHSGFGTALALFVVLGSGSAQYTENKPYWIPYIVGMLVLLGILEVLRGQWLGVLLGSALGMGLPYGVFWLNQSRKPSNNPK